MPSPAERRKPHFPFLSWFCGILAAVATGFLFDHPFRNMQNANHGTWTPTLIIGCTCVVVSIITGLLTGWK